MPRPGPRPYECVKRAWHSDRHQPVRGSIIRQIFRLAMEAHSAATRKNKEWQEKLPVVVLKAEEIMYSKANSEEEYTDADTMWNRVNDAIDTIIRRDESTETGPLLPPCVEAALNLGCIAVRASRSQRHSSVRTYLGPKLQESVSATTNEPPYHHEYHQQAQQSSTKPSQTAQAAIPVDVLDNSNKRVATPRGYPFLHESMQMHQKPLAIRQGTSTAPGPAPAPVNLGSVYPLYYGGNNQTQQADMPFRVPEAPIIIGMPIGIKPPEEATERVCDLSLRLGISSEPSTRIDIGSSRAYPGRNQEELCLFSEVKKNDRFDWFSNSEGQNSDSRVKKHKTLCGDFL
ncbi:hypothetical protein ISN45_Aa03g026620 [Arabidopsis thaliana x Arabidopsis arenosa]|uniref:Coactivator CBP, KIX domain-containing protein n=1 Tax=Arabidopsis thaliana x Arabidopsis arenosa TaxID=1240361 RepID=A0A8T2AW33_9BRAS|nr:hypothetical protein ISN45_Aa03g026620 [Arabidopsis thaliana x Arabidopsis arenosa]